GAPVLGPERIGERYVAQLAPALREAAGKLVALPGKPELVEHRVGFPRHLAVAAGERRNVAGLAFAGKDRQRDVVEGGKVVEQIYELEAARNSCLDALVHLGVADVLALEDDFSGVGAVICA